MGSCRIAPYDAMSATVGNHVAVGARSTGGQAGGWSHRVQVQLIADVWDRSTGSSPSDRRAGDRRLAHGSEPGGEIPTSDVEGGTRGSGVT